MDSVYAMLDVGVMTNQEIFSENNEMDINNNSESDRMSNPSQAVKLNVKKHVQQLNKKSPPEIRKSTRKLYKSGRTLVLLLDKKDIEDDLRAIQTRHPLRAIQTLATPLTPSPPAATRRKTSRTSRKKNLTSKRKSSL